MGVAEYVAARVHVYKQDNTVLSFGLAQAGYVAGSVPPGDYVSDLISVSWGRQIGKGAAGAAGRMAFVLPGRTEIMTGRPWSEVLDPGDYCELEVTCNRYPDPDGNFNTPWEGRFAGFLEDAGLNVTTEDGAELTAVSVSDSMGTLDYEHYAYWRNVGAVFNGVGNTDNAIGNLQALELAKIDSGQLGLLLNTIAGAADVLFRALLYSRLAYQRQVGKKDYFWDQLHGYRFESDDFATTIEISSLAPEGSSWMDAVSWAIDAPGFYEFFLDNLPKSQFKQTLRNGGSRDVGLTTNIKYKEPPRKLLGDRAEMFVIRPLPFPTYNPKTGYRSAAWDALPTIEALPFGNVQSQVTRSRRDVYSTFSVDLVNSGYLQNNDAAAISNAAAVVVGDTEAYYRKVGYRPLDMKTKRWEAIGVPESDDAPKGDGVPKGDNDRAAFAEKLAWQSFSYNQFNDRFYSGSISGPLDLRAQLGVRYVNDGMTFYVEGYQHTISGDVQGTSTDWTVSRGLWNNMYGVKTEYPQHSLGRMAQTKQWKDEQDLFPKYLGRKRPGELYSPTLGSALLAVMAKVPATAEQ